MKEFEMNDGEQFKCEKLMADKFEKGTCAFKVVDADGNTSYWVVCPVTLQGQIDGEVIDTPNDGHVTAFCMSEQDALMVASSICVAANITHIEKKALADTVEHIAKQFGFDIEKLDAEVKRLKAEGKTLEEVREILKPRMEEFKRADVKADAKQEGGKW